MNFRLFSPIHILWINLITDTFPAIALGMEKAEEDSMRKPPRDAKEGIFANGLGISIIYQGVIIALLTIISFFMGNVQSHAAGMTMAFVTLSMCEVFHSLNLRSRTRSIFSEKGQNKYLLLAMLASFILTVLVVYIPGLNNIFDLTALSPGNFFRAMALAFAIIPIVEIEKLIRRTTYQNKEA
jgi:Ca2+-transporting ATPase